MQCENVVEIDRLLLGIVTVVVPLAPYIFLQSMGSKCLRAKGLGSTTLGISDLDPYLITNKI